MQFLPFSFQYFLLPFNVDASFPFFFHLYLYAANSDREFLRKQPLDLCQIFSITLVLHCFKLFFAVFWMFACSGFTTGPVPFSVSASFSDANTGFDFAFAVRTLNWIGK